MGGMASVREPWDWLDDPARRRESLKMVRLAIRAGWLSGDGPGLAVRRESLVAKLLAIFRDPESGDRERLAVAKVFVAGGMVDMGVRRWRT